MQKRRSLGAECAAGKSHARSRHISSFSCMKQRSTDCNADRNIRTGPPLEIGDTPSHKGSRACRALVPPPGWHNETLSPNLNLSRSCTAIAGVLKASVQVWACRLVNTEQSESLMTLAVVEPSSICRKMPDCVGMMMRSNRASLAIRAISVRRPPKSGFLGTPPRGTLPSRRNQVSRPMPRCCSETSEICRT